VSFHLAPSPYRAFGEAGRSHHGPNRSCATGDRAAAPQDVAAPVDMREGRCESPEGQSVNRPSVSISHSSTVLSRERRGTGEARCVREPKKTERAYDGQHLHRQRAPGRLRHLLPAIAFEFAQPEACFSGARTGRVGMFIGVLPQPEQQLVAVQGRDRTTEQSLSVDRSPRLPARIGRCHVSPRSSVRRGSNRPSMVSATERGLVSGSPMSWAAWRASLRSRTRQKTSVGSPPTIAIVILGVKALGLSFRSCGSIKVAYQCLIPWPSAHGVLGAAGRLRPPMRGVLNSVRGTRLVGQLQGVPKAG